jgi:nuclear protein localization protein 4 homolog
MVAEGVLEASPNLGMCAVNDTFTAYIEGKPTKEIDTDFFICRVPVKSFESEILVSEFPRCNRIGNIQTRDDLKRQLNKAGKKGWPFISQLADFHLLLYLCQFLDINHDIPSICKSVIDKSVPLDEGYTLLIRSLAGMD